MMLRAAITLALLLSLAVAPAAARPLHEFAPPKAEAKLDRETLCSVLEEAAAAATLPVGFFARLIHTESRFDPMAVSPKGAQGIAQFMRGTADMRGLADPFDPEAAIRASADYLSDLRKRFGNLGLAAAAYNAGENRVARWLAGGTLPFETRGYVWRITGRAPEDWLAALEIEDADETEVEPTEESCLAIASGAGAAPVERVTGTEPATAPWGVQLAGNYSLQVAMASYRRVQRRFPAVLDGVDPMVVTRRVGGRGPRPFYRLQAPAQSRQEAQSLGGELRRAGGDCLVQRNR